MYYLCIRKMTMGKLSNMEEGRMAKYMVMAAMKGEFLARSGNVYENFQILGYVEASSPFDAVKNIFEVPQITID